MVLLTGEVAFPLHGAIILALGIIQYDAHPFPRGKEGGTDVGNSTALTLPRHLHYGADLGEEEQREDERQSHHARPVDRHLFISSHFFLSCLRVER